jgi:two-component system sensor histidine kinase UhpB
MTTDWQLRHPDNNLSLDIQCHLPSLSEQAQLVLYRTIQESLTNISRHAGSHLNVSIKLYRQADAIMIAISDDGRGCELNKSTSGYGLRAMRERLDALSGELIINSQPGHGMQIKATFPCWVGE